LTEPASREQRPGISGRHKKEKGRLETPRKTFCQRCGAGRHIAETRTERVSRLTVCADGCPPHPEDVVLATLAERSGHVSHTKPRFLRIGEVRPEDL
jgi:hypothetical protein